MHVSGSVYAHEQLFAGTIGGARNEQYDKQYCWHVALGPTFSQVYVRCPVGSRNKQSAGNFCAAQPTPASSTNWFEQQIPCNGFSVGTGVGVGAGGHNPSPPQISHGVFPPRIYAANVAL